jgi:hypothetical protein
MKKRLLPIAAILTVVAGAIILTLLPVRPGVTKANFDRLAMGMSRNEVEAVFGRPCDDSHCHSAWNSDDGQAHIHFNEHGQIERKLWFEAEFSLYQKLQRRFPWLPD